jgi:riboflavin transporter FmnP
MSRRIALGGILTALCVLLNYVAAFMPSGKLGLYVLSSLPVAAAAVELDMRGAMTVYAASAMLIFLLSGNINALLLFTLFFGIYPIIKYYAEKQTRASLEMLIKYVGFNGLGMIGYFAYRTIFGISPVNFSLLPPWMIAGAILAAEAVFLIYDYVLSRLIHYYVNRIKAGLK